MIDLGSGKPHTDAYFAATSRMEAAINQNDVHQASLYVYEALEHVSGFVDESNKRDSGKQEDNLRALEFGGLIFAMLDDTEGIARIREVVSLHKELARYREIHNKHEQSRLLFRVIENIISEKPGILPRELKTEIAANKVEVHGESPASLAYWLSKAGRIRRVPYRNTNKLFPITGPGAAMGPPKPIVRDVGSHHQGRMPRVKLVDWSAIQHIPLPVSPTGIQDNQNENEDLTISSRFEIYDGSPSHWMILGIEKLPENEAPSMEFSVHYTTSNGAVALDPRGASDPTAFAAAIRYGSQGSIKARAPLAHGLYRVGVSTVGGCLIGLSRAHIAHAYDPQLRLVMETDLAISPVVIALKKKLRVDEHCLHNNLRTVAINDDATRYIFSMADQAWCFDIHGNCIWSLRLPLDLIMPGNVSTYEDGTIAIDYDVTVPDWIYGTAFAGNENRAFLSGYSGKVVEVDESGNPIRYYSIDSSSTRIVAQGDRLIFLTGACFYMFRDSQLIAFDDSIRGGDAFLTPTGAGLLEKRRFRWLNKMGIHVGTILSRDPIRRIYNKSDELVVETRTHRVRISGPEPWM